MITLNLAIDRAGVAWAQDRITAEHYLHAPVDSRCRPLVYIARISVPKVERTIGCLMFGRPEATRCYQGRLTYGSLDEVRSGRAQFDRWEILNLARVWLDPCVQQPGMGIYHPAYLPGFIDRRGIFRSTLASHLIGLALARVGYDYLAQHPPVDCAYPYAIRAVLSYCDTRIHKGTIYRASGFELARTNKDQIETWYTTAVGALSVEQDAGIRRLSEQAPRSRRIRAEREVMQLELVL